MILIRFPCYCLHFFLENWCSRPLHNAPAGVISIFVIRIPFGFCQALAVWILHDTIFMCDWFVVKIILGTKLHLPKEKKWTVPNQVLLRRRVAVVPTVIEISKYRLMMLPNFVLFWNNSKVGNTVQRPLFLRQEDHWVACCSEVRENLSVSTEFC